VIVIGPLMTFKRHSAQDEVIRRMLPRQRSLLRDAKHQMVLPRDGWFVTWLRPKPLQRPRKLQSNRFPSRLLQLNMADLDSPIPFAAHPVDQVPSFARVE
jgi:hypothetical protein